MSILTQIFWGNYLAGLFNAITFWSIPIIIGYILKKKYPKQYKKFKKLVTKISKYATTT